MTINKISALLNCTKFLKTCFNAVKVLKSQFEAILTTIPLINQNLEMKICYTWVLFKKHFCFGFLSEDKNFKWSNQWVNWKQSCPELSIRSFKEPAMGTWVSSVPNLSTRTLVGNLQSDPPDWNFPNWSSQPVTPLLLKALGTWRGSHCHQRTFER